MIMMMTTMMITRKALTQGRIDLFAAGATYLQFPVSLTFLPVTSSFAPLFELTDTWTHTHTAGHKVVV